MLNLLFISNCIFCRFATLLEVIKFNILAILKCKIVIILFNNKTNKNYSNSCIFYNQNKEFE